MIQSWSIVIASLAGAFVDVTAFSRYSEFVTNQRRYAFQKCRSCIHKDSSKGDSCNNLVMYNDPPKNSDLNAWLVISSTERWISETLKTNNQASPSTVGGSNPYARKEVSYFCETSQESPIIVSGIFRMLREARERGESHAMEENERARILGLRDYSSKTLRQTHVVVIPGSQLFSESFVAFDKVIAIINQARRDARDYITDAMLEKIENAGDESDLESEWSVSINLAHLHPNFGETSQEQQIDSFEKDKSGKIDANLEAYKRARLLARRSPYPTVVLEVRATPPPDFGDATAPSSRSNPSQYIGKGEEKITAADIQRLEALFGKSAICDKGVSGDESFWNMLGSTIQEVSSLTPIKMAQQWVKAFDPRIGHHNSETVSFTETSTMYVDAAYEFVFTNIAMMMQDSDNASNIGSRYFLVMPNFLSSAATSFEKFAIQVRLLIQSLLDINGTFEIMTYHPEHIDPNKRSPMPIFAMQWRK